MRVKALKDTVIPSSGQVVPEGMVFEIDDDEGLIGSDDLARSREELTVDVGALMVAYFDRHPVPRTSVRGPHG